MDLFLLSFVPLFVAIDALGIIPLYLSMTKNLSLQHRSSLLLQALATALVISLVFLFAGRAIFSFLGISADDFRVAGGLVLLIIAVKDLVSASEGENSRDPGPHLGVVPLGIPLIMGPAALTTILILQDTYGLGWVLASLLTNLMLVFVVFRYAHILSRIMGPAGSLAFAKVASLFLAAIAVMMIRVGLLGAFQALKP